MSKRSRWELSDSESSDASGDSCETKRQALDHCTLRNDDRESSGISKHGLLGKNSTLVKCLDLSHQPTLVSDNLKLREFVRSAGSSTQYYVDSAPLGEGSFGLVYRAQLPSGESVALKHLKHLVGRKKLVPLSVVREVHALSRPELAHPNIIGYHGLGLGSDGRIFVMLELCSIDLCQLILRLGRRGGALFSSEVRFIFLRVLRGLEAIHECGLMHRDIKPSNILIGPDQVKICDFGTARSRNELPESKASPLSPGRHVTTISYRAPELLLGARNYDSSVDLWSAGVVFAEMLLLRPLFPRDTTTTECAQLARVFKVIGTPNERTWPGFGALSKGVRFPSCSPGLQTSMMQTGWVGSAGYDLLYGLLNCDPRTRPSAAMAGSHSFFSEEPKERAPRQVLLTLDDA